MSEPLLSVIMAVYNAEDHVAKAIDSILGQSFGDFEFIIVDDGSTDATAKILKQYNKNDPRIIIYSQNNTGLTIALNKGLEMAQGKYIARQDADDFSYPQRFEKQIDLLESEPTVILVGSNCDDFYPDGFQAEWGYYKSKELQQVVYIKTPFAHSTVMMRADACRDLGGYDPSFKTSQDMELWMRFARKGKLAMVEESLIKRTISKSSISAKRRWRQFYDALRARWRHNPGRRTSAVYHSLRGLLIGFLPYSFMKSWRMRREKKLRTAI